jgi:hypothetical protein
MVFFSASSWMLVFTFLSLGWGKMQSAVATLLNSHRRHRDKSSALWQNLTVASVEALVATSDTKEHYFRQLQKITPLTKGKHTADIRVSLPKAHFVGDSISRELSEAYNRISTTNKGLVYTHTGDIIGQGNDILGIVKNLLHSCADYDVFFLSSNTLHILVDQTFDKKNPIASHRTAATQLANIIKCVESATGAIGIYVGSMAVDPQLLLAPVKKDWASFSQFDLLRYWGEIDKQVCLQAGVHIFDPGKLQRECPGVRCDGMHFASAFEQWHCSSSAFLWDIMLADYMKTLALVQTTAQPKQKSLSQCRPATAYEVYQKCITHTGN